MSQDDAKEREQRAREARQLEAERQAERQAANERHIKATHHTPRAKDDAKPPPEED